MNFKQDFAAVDLILDTKIETRGVDSFILSFLKCEKQARRIFTFLIFQNPSYSDSDYQALRSTLSKNKSIYFKNFISGIELILPHSLEDIYGQDYQKDLGNLLQFVSDRNKIFHGQVTMLGLSRADLIDRVEKIKKWCENLGEKMEREIGYNGFSKSYVKSTKNLSLKNLKKFSTIVDYEQFLKKL